jgi:multidrug efflux system membrane fusion protein
MSPRATFPALSALALACVAVTGCAPAPPEGGPMPPPAVTVSYPLEREVTDHGNFTGRTAAVESVKVRARVWGYLHKINFTEGALVNKDDVLFEIDPTTYQTAVDQAKARLALAEAQLAQNTTEAERNASLRARGGVSQEDFERAMTARTTAAASVDSARADLKRAQIDLEFTKVRAPVSGVVSRALVTVGNLVQSGEMGGTVLTTVVSVDPMYAYFDVDDLTFQQVKDLVPAGKYKYKAAPEALPPVLLGLAGEKGYPHRGVIDFVDNQVDPGTGTLRVRGVFPNKDGALTPGLFARVRVPLGKTHPALLVCDRAVDTDQGRKVLYVVNADSVAEKRDVRLGKLHDGLREIESGLRRGERVIVDGLQRVRAGAPVEPKLAEMPVADSGQESVVRSQ